MPASANTAPTIYHLQENKNITEYRLDKTPFDRQSPYPTDSSTLHSSGSLSLPSIMKDNCLPNQSSVSSRFSTDSSILHSPISSHGNITSDFSKLDTLAAAAGSILVSLANLGQPTSATALASAKPEDSGSNESSKKDIIQCSDNLADLAAAAISSLSDLAATGREVSLPKQVEKLASRTSVAISNEHKKGGFMSISALLDEGPPRSNENPSQAYTPSFGQLQSYDSSKHTVKQLLDDVNIIAGDRERQSTKRLMSEPELPFKKRYAPSRFDSPVNSRSNSVSYHHDGNEVFNGNSAGGYMNAVAVDQNTSLPQPDSSYSRSSRYNGSYQHSGASSTQSAPIPRYKPAAHGSASNFPDSTASTGNRNPQPSYQPLRVEGPNTFSKKYQSMQDPKVKRNATHAYIAYMIYTDRLQNKGSEVKGESMPIHSTAKRLKLFHNLHMVAMSTPNPDILNLLRHLDPI
ncbi:hypothetical protein K7432_008587 [Basidiobolus ranarum]|uniref:Uncharacterized protein n=1 Tax=Basidiobolus ranarum TaxID=34480 RepID=A0ABR2VZ87_9FUNG